MTDDKKKENSLIPIGSTDIVRVSNSLAITQKILNEIQQRFDPLAWWQTIDDNLKLALYANIIYGESIKKHLGIRRDFPGEKRLFLGKQIESIQNLDIITIESILQLKFLHARGFNLSNIKPIEQLTSLTRLDLSYNQISDISPLNTLTNLTYLGLVDNNISELNPLTSLNNLTRLFLYNNQISDIRPLSALSNLTCLSLSNNQITDVSPLKSLTNLTTFRFERKSNERFYIT
jgi:Leucine-rich repeat (LRR) protein